MTRRLALLRGINVGGHNKVPMADLRVGLESAGFTDVATYIQSGNIVATPPASAASSANASIAADISAVIADVFDFDIPVVVRRAQELAAVIQANPFPDAASDEPKFLQVFFCPEALRPDALAGFDVKAHSPDRVAAGQAEVYVAYDEGMSRSKLDNKVIDRQLGVATTARNWNTVLKLAAMLDL